MVRAANKKKDLEEAADKKKAEKEATKVAKALERKQTAEKRAAAGWRGRMA